MRTFCFDNISKDKQQFKYKPTVIYDILFLQSEKAPSQSKPKGEGLTYFHPIFSNAHGFTNWLNANVAQTTKFIIEKPFARILNGKISSV